MHKAMHARVCRIRSSCFLAILLLVVTRVVPAIKVCGYISMHRDPLIVAYTCKQLHVRRDKDRQNANSYISLTSLIASVDITF